MKILSIRIKNLASLEGLTIIDFTQESLASAGIFAITGPTGAGKSTILDALCLALYSKTPRYQQARESGIEITDVQGSAISQGDVRSILRDGTGEGFAEVDFAGVDGQRYRATWRVRRARDRAEGSLQSFSIALKNIDTNTDIPGKKTELQDEIERLVGLNFEQFTRSVLLAQGDFTAFLKAAKDEKSALLEKLTGTHIYSEISKQIFANYRKEERELDDLNLQRSGIPTLTSEELEAIELQKTALEQRIAVQEKEAELLTREINWHFQLTILQSSLAAAETAQKLANEAKQQATGRTQELRQVEQVQPTRTWIDSQQTAKSQLSEKTIILHQLQEVLHNLQKQKEELDAKLQKANDDVVAKTKKQEEAIPFLEEARALDIQISEKTTQFNQSANDVKEADAHYQQEEQQLKNQQQYASQLMVSIENLQQWKKDNTSRQPIAENQGLISSKLIDARKLLDAIQLLSPQLDITLRTIDLTKQAKNDLETKSTRLTQTLQKERDSHKIADEVLAAIPIAILEKEKEGIDLSMEDIIKAEAHWKILFSNQADLNNLKQKLDYNKKELENKTQLLAKTIEQLVVVTAERDTSLYMLNKARLAAAENVEYLRTQLTPGETCPVCGSTEHPYAIEHPQLNFVLQQLEAVHKQHEYAYTNCLATEHSLRETGNHLKETIEVQEEDLRTKDAALEMHKKTWESFAIYSNAANVPDDQKADWLAQQLQIAKTKQKGIQSQIELYATKKQELDTLQNKLNDLDRQLNENTNALKDTERNLQSLQEQWAQYNKEQLNHNNALAEIEKNLSIYFTVQDWFGHWKNKPAAFLQSISEFSEKWKTTIQELDENSRQYGVLSATLKATQEKVQSLYAELQKKQKAFTEVQEQLDALTKKRKGIFNGEAAATIELGLKQAVASAQQIVEKCKAERDQLQIEITRTGTQKEQAEKDMASLQQQADSFAIKIQEWIKEFNEKNNLAINTDKLVQLLAFSSEWIENERAALRAIEDAITQTLSVLQERTTQVQQHEQQRLSERRAAELYELLNTAKTELQQQTQEKNEISFRLQQDLANKQKIGSLLGFIEAKSLIVENWARLNEVIGSADGKKFRQIAQEYTLDVLLSYANVQLEMLSRRYLLQRIPNTLGLQVLDQDMGDEVRTVFSLSGGESFLVSLALALGLASLSSSRMQVESLFIDEGFGSLDPATLNIAMDALERLHNQGRKVGVISHVQEMTERIPVQIRVSKEHSGRSKVKISEIEY